jgi:hypothetical protein
MKIIHRKKIKYLGGFMIKRILVVMLMVILVPALVFSADTPKVKKGAEMMTVSGKTRSWKDMKKISADEMFSSRKMKPVMNFQNPKKIKKVNTKKDPVVQEGSLDQQSLAMPSTITDFNGMNLSSNGAGWPPDTNGDVGPTYFVQTVNTSIGIYNKSTGALVSATTFDSFFGGSTPCDADNNGDPIVLYDWYAQRWFILDFAWSGTSNGSYYSVAVSKTSDPTGDWWQYCLQADATLMNDYPKCGIWHDGIYTTANMFSFQTSAFQHAKVWAFKKPDIYNGTLTVQSLIDTSDQAWSLLPTNAKGTTAPVGPNYMYSIDADEYGGGSIDALYVWKMAVDWTNSNNTTWTGHSTMNVAAYGLTASRIPQAGTSTTLDSLYGRLMYPANYRNFGTHESVYLCHVAEHNSTRQMRWYEVRINNGTSSIYQQGTYAPDATHRWMGAIAGDKNGNIAMGYSASSTSIVPAIRYCGRLSTDALGTMGQGEATMIQGTGYQTSYTRWGDYSSMTVDPDDDETFWYTTEYYASNGTNWQTRIGSFKMGPVVPDTTPPVISNVAANNIGDTTADITWDTDENATSVVHYGLTTSYGSTETVSGYVTDHTVGLSGLTALTTYHYKVVSVDGSGNSSESGDYTFTTIDTPAIPDMYVNDIAMSLKNKRLARATINIKNTDGNNVSGATVYVTWSGGVSGTASGVTDASGNILFNSPRGGTPFTITVTNVTHATFNYNASLNVETTDTI